MTLVQLVQQRRGLAVQNRTLVDVLAVRLDVLQRLQWAQLCLVQRLHV